jgi:hypothetical protein
MPKGELRRFGVLALVAAAHALIVSFALRSTWKRESVEAAPTFVLLDLPAAEHLRTPPPSMLRRTPRSRRQRSESAAPKDAVNRAAPGETGGPATIDWWRELDISIERVAPDIISGYLRMCDKAERAHAPRPPGCNRRSFDGPWRPSGNWLLDMRDPDRPHSSVPDPLQPAFPKAPRPEAFRDE